MQHSEQNELAALDLLATAVLLVDEADVIVHANAAAEALLALSRRQLMGADVGALFDNGAELQVSLREAAEQRFADKSQTLMLSRPGLPPAQLSVTVVVLHGQAWPILLELRATDRRLRMERAAEQMEQAEANRELLRNLAHEVKNPLGGLRGAAQLLQAELSDRGLIEYTGVIMAEADRLHALVDRLLAPHRAPHVVERVNIHEVCEHVTLLVGAEAGAGLEIVRDYDISVPELQADRQQLIQTVLNIVRNAAQALDERRLRGDACITLRTRVARQITLARGRHPLVLVLEIMDNGPGVPDSIRERIFHPLVSAREGGIGLGLSLAQTFIQQHGGAIECVSRPGHTVFRLMLPLSAPQSAPGSS